MELSGNRRIGRHHIPQHPKKHARVVEWSMQFDVTAQTVSEKLRARVTKKCHELWKDGRSLHKDNATVREHPDLAPCDSHFF